MEKIIINENQRGLVFNKGKFVNILDAGKYRYRKNTKSIVVMNLKDEFCVKDIDINILLRNKELADNLEVVDIGNQEIVLHYVNEKIENCLTQGVHGFWNIYDNHTFMKIDMSDADSAAELDQYMFNFIPRNLYTKIEIESGEKALLYFDKVFVRLLGEGTYYFWNSVKVEHKLVDTRLLQMDVIGQEMLTADKVGVRINFVCHYKIADYVKINTEIQGFEEQLHVILQMTLRKIVSGYKMDELLSAREEISDLAFKSLKEKEKELFVEIKEAGIKDIILPGEVRDIMNTVLIAEKKAQANVITRREEVASTRSLLNTAKLMEENQTLYKLKELEYIEKICQSVDSIEVGNGGDILTQLTKLIERGV